MPRTRNVKTASVAENSELMEKHLLPRVMYSRNFFFSSLHKTLEIYLFYSAWASSWEKAVLEEMGFVPRERVVRASGLNVQARLARGRTAALRLSRQQPRARPGPPLLALCSPSTACICTACARVFKCSSFPKPLAILSPLKLLALILKVFIRFVRQLY